MKTIELILSLSVVIAGESYGYYKLYKNYDGEFYDYGAGVYHAYNGSSPGQDSDDGVCTDRGVYLNGINTYVTFHSDHWQAPVISFPLEINTWILLLKFPGIIIRRYEVSKSSRSIIRLRSDGQKRIQNRFYTSPDFGESYTKRTFTTSTNSMETGKWYFIRAVYKDQPTLEAFIEINGVLMSTYSETISESYFESSLCMTETVSNDTTTEGFIYIFNFFAYGSFDYTLYFTSSCLAIVDPCSYCPFDECLSESSNPFENNQEVLCSAFGCSNGCNVSGQCFDCDFSSWPVCTDSGTIPTDLCDSSCKGCSGPNNGDCLVCSDSLHVLSGSPGTCECPSGMYFNESCKGKIYSDCHEDCLECEQENVCTSCKAERAILGEEGCDCPSGMSLNGNSCECDIGFFDKDLSAGIECEECHQDCLECEQENVCTICNAQGAVPAEEGCECPLRSSLNGNSCECDIGFFDKDTSAGVECEECHQDCLECEQENVCIICKVEGAVPGTEGCDCPSGSSLNGNSCECDIGFFDKDTSAGIECEECHQDCLECEQENICTSCKAERAIVGEEGCDCPSGSSLNGNSCECDIGFFDKDPSAGIECEGCHQDCLECEQENICTICNAEGAVPGTEGCECPSGSSLNGNSCECDIGFFDKDLSAGVECEECHQDCLECEQESVCTICKVEGAVPAEEGCECPLRSSLNGNSCECEIGFFDRDLSEGVECEECHQDCLECEQENVCTSCNAEGAVPGTEGCECPSHSSLNGNLCECEIGFFDKDSSAGVECEECHQDCLECEQENVCTSCNAEGAIPADEGCECPSGSSLNGNLCECDIGFFDKDLSAGIECEECHQDCLECEQENVCTICNAEGAVPAEEGCECPSRSSLNGNSCECDIGFFDKDTSAGVECEECPQDCLSCDRSAMCTSCNNPQLIPNSQGGCECPTGFKMEAEDCVCDNGYFEKDGQCLKCEESCEECNENGCQKCSVLYAFVDDTGKCSCPSNSSLQEGVCECDKGYYGSGECKQCKIECDSCSDDEYCLSCKDKNSTVEEGKCKCPYASFLKEDTCVCEENFKQQSSDKFECRRETKSILEELSKPVSCFKNIIVTITASITAVLASISRNPMNLCSIFNTLQMLSYFPLHNMTIPSQMDYVTSNFDIKNFIPNIVLLLFEPCQDVITIDKLNWKKHMETVSFYENIGEYITTLLLTFLSLVIHLILLLLFPRSSGCLKKRLGDFRYNVFIRIFLDLYLLLLFGSIISFSLVMEHGRREIEHLIGACFFGVGIAYPVVLGFFLYTIKSKTADTNIKSRFGTLFKDFETSENSDSLMFDVLFSVRRLFYMISLFYFYSFPKFQILVNVVFSFINFYFLLKHVQFKRKGRQTVEAFCEFTLFLFFSMAAFFVSNVSDYSKDIVANIMIGTIVLNISVHLCYFATVSIYKIIKKIMKNKIGRTKVIQIQKIEDDRIFSPSRDNISNIQGDNNTHLDITNVMH